MKEMVNHNKQNSMNTRKVISAKAAITVRKYEPIAYDEPKEGPNLINVHVEESFKDISKVIVLLNSYSSK